MLGSIDVSDINAIDDSNVQTNQRIAYSKPSTAGRKRLQLIPGDIDKTISIQLPSTLIRKIQEYGLANGQTMKETIGLILLEKFMK